MLKKKQNKLGYMKEGNKSLFWICIILMIIGIIALIVLGIWARLGLAGKIGWWAWFL